MATGKVVYLEMGNMPQSFIMVVANVPSQRAARVGAITSDRSWKS